MKRNLIFTLRADKDVELLEQDPSKKNILKVVLRTLAMMESNLRHPSLNNHEITTLSGPNGEKLFEAYAQL